MPGQYKVAKCRIAEAYRSWFDEAGTEKGVERNALFLQKLRTVLRLNNHACDTKPLPTTRQTWLEWKTKPTTDCVTLSWELAAAIKAVTEQDVTPDRSFSDHCNFTSLVTLVGTPRGRTVSNRSEDGLEIYELSIDRIAFRRSEPMRVQRCYVSPKAGGGGEDIGSVTLVLREAHVTLSVEGDIHPIVTELAPGSGGKARADRVALSDDPRRPGTWVATPDKEYLEGSVYLPAFANAKCPKTAEINVAITAYEAAIDTDFRPQGEELESASGKAKARKHLIDKVLSLDLVEQSRTLCLTRATVRK